MSETLETHEYVPAMRSSYKCMLTIVVLFVVALLLSFVKSIETEHKYLLGVWILWIIISTALVIYMKLKTIGAHLYVRPEEVAYDTGILSLKSVEISYKNLRTVIVTQTLMQRILNLGNISIASSGTDGMEIIAPNMPNPYAIRDEIQANERRVKEPAPAPAASAAPEQAE